ncbi:metal-dependent transcriptional regulator [bacterium]|nr:metal-dependent transcriptional regulator [bacterium]
MISFTEENYLKSVFHLSNVSSEVSVKDVSADLGIKMPTVTSMMKKLAAKGLVEYQSYKPVKLTPRGQTEAALVIRKHRLTEMFLVEHMGFGWEEVHEIAEQIEHVKAPALFNRMDEIMGHPKVDPHGSPIPDRHGKIMSRKLRKLSELSEGDTFTIEAVTNSEDDFLNYLNQRDLSLGTVLQVVFIEPFDFSITVRYKDKETILSKTVSDRLLGE